MWDTKIKDLRDAGLKLQEIGDACGLKRAAIHNLATGRNKEPRKSVAILLDKFHAKTMRKLERSRSHEA